ncbi:MAG: DUF3102 domain-containing protein [Chroococcidiopsidaceae cyanobacterium CP_BM_ER_R8_30]|nr:DUF3102 domain-containing protein [Chroococcidiopsidaceae cyanobacterium CP_BM_ER_R8_30]
MPTSSSPKVPHNFDYTSLDIKTSQFVQQQTGEIRGLMKRTTQSIAEIGHRLIEVKSQLGHGRFGDWLAAEFEWSQDTASNFINVAKRFGQNPKISEFNIAASALYLLAAPSTPITVCSEVLSRAEAGEAITYKKARALKEKYATPLKQPLSKSALETVSQSQSPQFQALPLPPDASPSAPVLPLAPVQTTTVPSEGKLEIAAIIPQVKAPIPEEAPKPALSQAAQHKISQPSRLVSAPDMPGVWWQLGGRHFLYCGNPNSDAFLARIPEVVQLLLAFPPTRIWQSRITAEARIILTDYLPIFHESKRLDEAIEPLILNYSRLGDLVVTCFLPSPDILSIINRLNRRGVIAELNSRRSKAVISDWKRAGLKVERLG